MPVIPRAKPRPLPPEGPAKLHVLDVTFGRSKEKKTAYFELTLLDLSSKLTLKDRIYLTEGSAWKADAACRSMGHTLPAGQYRLQIDDLVNRLVYGCIIHQTLPTGIVTAQMKTYWRREFALQQNTLLENIPDPKGVLGPVELPLVEETSIIPEPPKEDPPPATKTAPVTPPPTNTPSGEAKPAPSNDDELGEISGAELAQAFLYATKLRARKEGQKPGE